jgi:uncharacterized RDD family membrane protein YckC
VPIGYSPYGIGSDVRHDYATFGARLGGYIIDILVMALIALPFEVVGWIGFRKAFENCYSVERSDGTTAIRCPDGALQGGWLAAGIVLAVLGAVVALVIYCRKVAGGQSWGQKAVNIRIVDAQTGGGITAGKVFWRQVCRIFSQMLCFLGYFWMLWDSKSQCWHDKMVGTVVIKT